MTAARDPGLQPERTVLAWRRTLLAVAVGAAVSVRVLAPALGEAAIVTGLGGVVIAGVLWVLARRRHALVAAVFRGDAASMPGGALLLALAAVISAAAALGLAAALLGP